ncbi:MAG: SGNH/GDSL hydrolase family protein [Lachnospiraceae bacterium]|jgi:lysophospholipase L1-like esterase|nr:SGNH/GDSL hydrolase family protein [Lachnospiraceae bacterium]
MYNILCYGDSNTWCVNTEEQNCRIEYKKRWTQVMACKLGENYHVIEEGLPGRTTVFEDPFGYGRHGEKYIEIALMTHNPIDLLIIMLGTNDMKDIYHATAEESAWGLERIILKAKSLFSQCFVNHFKILVVSPIHISETMDGQWYYGFSEKSVEKSKQLAEHYKKIADIHGCEFLDAAQYANASMYDGVHMANNDNERLGEEIAQKVKKVLEFGDYA